jgi:N-acetylglucosaminyldiphosphoundecaprenol N-acetyl-beta-D-mannosaminyltransferase
MSSPRHPSPSTTPEIDSRLKNTKRNLFGIDIDNLRMQDAVDTLRQWVESNPSDSGCRFVVTPNVDHAVLLSENEPLRAAYDDAHLILADGHPIIWASRLLKQPLPERVAGSELVPALFDSFDQRGDLKVFLLGAGPGVAETASANMKSLWPNVKTVGLYSPPMGFEKDDAECENILQKISDCQPDVVIVGLGAPKQELWVHRFHKRIDAKAALCVGATIDFLAGEKQRAPIWMQKSGLEWLHRMCSEPKRLVKRYARDAWIFPQLVFRQMISG